MATPFLHPTGRKNQIQSFITILCLRENRIGFKISDLFGIAAQNLLLLCISLNVYLRCVDVHLG